MKTIVIAAVALVLLGIIIRVGIMFRRGTKAIQRRNERERRSQRDREAMRLLERAGDLEGDDLVRAQILIDRDPERAAETLARMMRDKE